MEKRKQWSFRMSTSNSWSWHARDIDDTESVSDREFETLAECIVDAKVHGYVVWTLAEDRRREAPDHAVE